MLERRTYLFDIDAGQNERGNIITGRPIVYNSKTDIGGMFEEVIDFGALDKTDLRDVRFLVNHNMDMIPLARSRRNNGNSTMTLAVDSEGLGINVVLDTENNADARALYSAVERRDLDGMSFAFVVDGEKWENLDSDYPTRHITNIASVIEVSAVTFPAYESTEINARSSEALENAKEALENAKRSMEIDTSATNETELILLKEHTKLLGGI